MNIRLLFFGRLREAFASAGETLSLPIEQAAVSDVVAALRRRGGVWEQELAKGMALGFAVGRQIAGVDSPVRDGDEVAIFPPITGG